MTDPIHDTVIRILAEQAVLEPRDVSPEQTLTDLGIDSLGLVECIFAIEETFDISVPFNANDPAQSQFDIYRSLPIIGAVKTLMADQNGA